VEKLESIKDPDLRGTAAWALVQRDETMGSGQRPGGVISGGTGAGVTGTKDPATLIEPEIRWDPPSDALATGKPIDPALNAIAVTPDAAHTVVPGAFAYAPGPGTLAGAALVSANKGAWAPGTVYASGDRVSGGVGVWRATTPGTSGGAEPAWPTADAEGHVDGIGDGTVAWEDDSASFLVTATFTPDDPAVYASAEAVHAFHSAPGAGLLEPEIRWEPGTVSVGEPLAPACNATAVTPDDAHLPVAGEFAYSPGPETLADPAAIVASKGPWAADTIYKSGQSVSADGRVWRVTTPGTSGSGPPDWPPLPVETPPDSGTFPPTPSVSDGTVEWAVNMTDITLTATFTPADTTRWKTVTAEASITIDGFGSLIEPEIRWDPPSEVAAGQPLPPECFQALAVTPDPAATIVPGTFTFGPPAGTVADLGLVGAPAWEADTIYASGDQVSAGGSQFFRATTGGTSGGGPPAWPVRVLPDPAVPVADGTVTWIEDSDSFVLQAFFVPDDTTVYRGATESRYVRMGEGLGLKAPEIRWVPGAVHLGDTLDAACNASAVTPDAAHLPVYGTFEYSLPFDTIAGPGLVMASRGGWEAATVYASGDSVAAAGRVWRAAVPGTSGGGAPAWPAAPVETPPGSGTFPPTPSVPDGTVVWQVNASDITLRVTFYPEDAATWKVVTAEQSINVTDMDDEDASDLLTPDLRWTPGPIGLDGPLAPACNALAVDPTIPHDDPVPDDEAHLPVSGTYAYSPGPGTLVSYGLVAASRGWEPGTVYSSGDSVGGGGRVWRVAAAGTSGGGAPDWPDASDPAAPTSVTDFTVEWALQTGIEITLTFTPDDLTRYKAVETTQVVSIGASVTDTLGLLEPEIRWDPPSPMATGALLDAALTAVAVTPGPEHLVVPGTFTYTPGAGRTVSRGLVTASRGAWAGGTVYAAGDTVRVGAGQFFRASTPGTTGPTTPAWPVSGTVADGTVVWTEDSATFTVTAFFQPLDSITYKAVTTRAHITVEGGPEDEPDRFTLVARISSALGAEAVSYENENLDMDDLQFILAQLRATSGLWQVELSFVGVNIPWVRRGSIVQFTGVVDGAGDPLPLPPALLQTLTLTYDEGATPPAFTKDMRALAWTPTGTL